MEASDNESVSAVDAVPTLDNKPAEDKPEAAESNPEAPEDAEEAEEPESDVKSKERPVKSDLHGRPPPSQARHLALTTDSLVMFDAYKEKMRLEATRSDPRYQGSNLVKGLVDFLRVLEDRIDRGSEAKAKGEKTNDTTIKSTKVDDSTVEVTVKFFNAAAYTDVVNGSVNLISDEETEEGTFVCGHDTQQLIRVLYSKIRHEEAKPLRQADPQPPKADDINILTFGVSSEAISEFIENELQINKDHRPMHTDHLIRFGKPFKPIIRNLGILKKQLMKLESKYGQVTTEDATSETAANGSNTTINTRVSKEVHASPNSPTKKGEGDWTASYDRPSALLHFRILLAFVEQFFGDQIKLYERLKQGKEQYVAFENLWMLFDSNDTIYCPLPLRTEQIKNIENSSYTPLRRHNPQAYRVLSTFGGVPSEPPPRPPNGLPVMDDYVTMTLSGSEGANEKLEAITDMLTQPAIISRRIRNNYSNLIVYCFHIDFDGVEFGTVPEAFEFKPYEREIEIRSLEAYPARYMSEDHLYERGQKFLDYTRVSHLQYDGLTVGPSREEINSPVVVDAKLAFEGGPDIDNAFIDPPEFKPAAFFMIPGQLPRTFDIYKTNRCAYKWCYDQTCNISPYVGAQHTLKQLISSKVKTILEECKTENQRGKNGIDSIKQLMKDNDLIRLLPGALPGFALRNRKWETQLPVADIGTLIALFNITQFRPVEQNNEWDKLVLPPGHREMVQAMVETHTRDLGSNSDAKIGMDLVQGKGSGCIILLHGVPGVGKTSTAECVAAHTKKPLYPITCGDIGVQPAEVEKNMDNHFRLAHKWGCVLLLDEADVFLAKRDELFTDFKQQKDVVRNGLVSVFLRMLEYYSGILFLTTNRVGAIDDAFRSRLHLTLYYPKLTKKQTKQIFKQNFQRIGDINIDREKKRLLTFDYRDSEPKIMSWAMETWKSLRWNGRQIRNAFQTVLALAEFDSKNKNGESKKFLVSKRHFRIVANASVQFNEYLMATHGADEDRIAKRETMRAVTYSPSSNVVYRADDQDDSDSSMEENEDSSEGSGDDSDSDESDESDSRKRKSASKKGKGKGSKSKSKSKNEKPEKRSKEKRKEKKDKKKDDESE
ncbi:aaa family atpase protein [Rutstroemia sp. NJR-2017a BBW]|nr:aaa family atpase protein [Rutstroemia sp. NJR-2017a BBW]